MTHLIRKEPPRASTTSSTWLISPESNKCPTSFSVVCGAVAASSVSMRACSRCSRSRSWVVVCGGEGGRFV